MADSMLVRFEDDTARKVRDRAQLQGKSITAFLNDAVQAYLKQIEASEGVERVWESDQLKVFSERLADASHLIRERNDVWTALQSVVDCIEVMPFEGERNVDPMTWDQFKQSRLNPSGSDGEARKMFAQDYAEIRDRDWTWYLDTHRSENEAKRAWLRQRRRYGLPVPPPKHDA